MKKTTKAVAVVRFQGDELHPGWRYLIEQMLNEHGNATVVIGVAPFPTPRNPLSFEMIEAMVKRVYRKVRVLAHADHPSDKKWSEGLDALLARHFPKQKVLLYGSRKSFIPYYSGIHKTRVIKENGTWNGTQVRKDIARKPRHNQNFRRGVIYAWETRLAVTRPMVDIAVIDEARRRI